jgi:hypothetical protein
MRKYLFKKAKLLRNIEVISETDYSVRLKVGKYETVFKYQNHNLILLCSCSSGAYNKICSHVIAAMAYLMGDEKWSKN